MGGVSLGILGLVLLFVLGVLVERKLSQRRALRAGQLKVCPHCGRYYKDNPTYCPHCGEVVVKGSSRR